MKKLLYLLILPLILFLVSCGGGEGDLQPIDPNNNPHTFINHPDSFWTYFVDDNLLQQFEDLYFLSVDWVNKRVRTHQIDKITRLELFGRNITDMTGIENFTSLKTLYLGGNQLQYLNLTRNNSLEFVDCSGNQLTYLAISTSVTSLDCNNNQLTNLDLSKNYLQYLRASYNQITSLYLNRSANIKELIINDNPISYLDLNSNNKIRELEYHNTMIDSLDFSIFTELEQLSLYNTPTNSLDLSNNPILSNLNCSGTQIATLDLSNNPILSNLNCSGTQIATLDLSNNPIIFLRSHSNQLVSLDLRNGNNHNIQILLIDENPLLGCINVDDSIYSSNNWINSTSNWIKLDPQHYFSEDCP